MLITSIETYVGGYFDGYYNVKIDLVDKWVTWSHSISPDVVYNGDISTDIPERATEKLRELNILNWKNKYIDYEV